MYGIKTKNGFPLYDYDGEFQKKPGAIGRERVYKGYFGIGAILDSSHNQNSIVIPGMIHSIPDLLFGIIMRSYEFSTKGFI